MQGASRKCAGKLCDGLEDLPVRVFAYENSDISCPNPDGLDGADGAKDGNCCIGASDILGPARGTDLGDGRSLAAFFFAVCVTSAAPILVFL